MKNPQENNAWWQHELEQLHQTCAWSPEERLAWLEEALNFARDTGALQQTRQLAEAHGVTVRRQR